MRRVASHYIYWNELFRMHYVELDDAGCLLGVFPLEGEQAGTEFYDGIMLLVAAEGEKKVAHPIEICYASDPKPLGIDFLRNALSNIELPEWTEIGKPTDLLLLSVPLSATKLGTNNSSSNGYIKRL